MFQRLLRWRGDSPCRRQGRRGRHDPRGVPVLQPGHRGLQMLLSFVDLIRITIAQTPRTIRMRNPWPPHVVQAEPRSLKTSTIQTSRWPFLAFLCLIIQVFVMISLFSAKKIIIVVIKIPICQFISKFVSNSQTDLKSTCYMTTLTSYVWSRSLTFFQDIFYWHFENTALGDYKNWHYCQMFFIMY